MVLGVRAEYFWFAKRSSTSLCFGHALRIPDACALQVTSLRFAAYNAGVLHGLWINVQNNLDYIWAVINEMLTGWKLSRG